MNMKFAIAVAAALLTVACKKDDTVLTSQQTAITRYLTGSHSPRLVSQEQAATDPDGDKEYYTTHGETAYRYISTMSAEGRLPSDDGTVAGWTEVQWGDRVHITFDAYIFSGSAPSISSLYWSNNPDTINALSSIDRFDARFWTDADGNPLPLVITLGRTEVIKGLEIALAGCREGDKVEVYMTYNMAYGKKVEVGVVPVESAVVWLFKIDKVEKTN